MSLSTEPDCIDNREPTALVAEFRGHSAAMSNELSR